MDGISGDTNWVFFQWRVAAALATAWAATFASLHFTESSINWAHAGGVVRASLEICSPLLIAVAIGWFRPHKFTRGAIVLLWAWAVNIAFSVPVLAAARTGLPLRDSLFSSIDQLMGVSVAHVAQWTLRHDHVRQALQDIYGSLRWFTLAALVLCVHPKRIHHGQRLVLAAAYGLLITTGVSALLPAVGPWAAGGFSPLPGQVADSQSLMALRQHVPMMIGGQNARIVAFPSFHVCLAVLTALALRSLSRAIRGAAFGLALLITVSTVLLGWHYVCDAVAGGLLAMGCYQLAAAPQLRSADEPPALPDPIVN